MVMINKMKYRFLLLTLVAAITSCTNDNLSHENEPVQTSSELSCGAKQKDISDELISRSSLSLGSSSMAFAWDDEDWITVFAKDDDNAKQLYRLISGGGEPHANFAADNFILKKALLYYAFSKDETQNKHITLPDQNNVLVDYSGQTQIGNMTTDHLGEYDFMAAGVECLEENSAHFEFDHLGATFLVMMKFTNLVGDGTGALPSGDEKTALKLESDQPQADNALKMTRFTEMEIYDSENSFRQPNRYFSFKTGTSSDGKSYTFKWPEQEITSMDRFKLMLKSKDGTDGITSKEIIDQSNSLITFMEVPPADFTNKTIGIMVKGYYEKYENDNGEYKWVKHPVSYVQTYNKGWKFSGVTTHEVVGGKAYSMSNLNMEKPLDFKVTLKINHKWQHGSTLDESSRGTGDPGYDKEYGLPAHVYYILCVDNKVKTVRHLGTGTALAVNHFTTSTTEGTDWVTTADKTISSYKTNQLVFNIDKEDAQKSKHLYVVASKEAIPDAKFTSVTEGASEETVVRTLTYDITGSTDDAKQLFMRDLYSTPWSESNFVGDITDPVQDVILYHVAAKVDLKWNWNGTNPITTVSVNNVKNENLFLFKPTENAYTTGAYNINQPIPTELQKNGRYVFYLPQFERNNCKYNVTLGSHAAETIQFNPYEISTLGGFTSWLRWLKQK